jgi:hypothetical protein
MSNTIRTLLEFLVLTLAIAGAGAVLVIVAVLTGD